MFRLSQPVMLCLKQQVIRVKLYFSVKDPVRRFAAWLVKKSPANDMTFDEMSSMTWLLVDGKRTIFEISKLVNKDNKVAIEELLNRVVAFFRYLAKKGWINFKEANA